VNSFSVGRCSIIDPTVPASAKRIEHHASIGTPLVGDTVTPYSSALTATSLKIDGTFGRFDSLLLRHGRPATRERHVPTPIA
jgi:hypothetical protein